MHKTQDALVDRMITITVGQYDRETEIRITAAKSGLDEEDSARIVDIVREFREMGVLPLSPTVRACIMIGKVSSLAGSIGELRRPDLPRNLPGRVAGRLGQDHARRRIGQWHLARRRYREVLPATPETFPPAQGQQSERGGERSSRR